VGDASFRNYGESCGSIRRLDQATWPITVQIVVVALPPILSVAARRAFSTW
jgi:hypothetical protein